MGMKKNQNPAAPAASEEPQNPDPAEESQEGLDESQDGASEGEEALDEDEPNEEETQPMTEELDEEQAQREIRKGKLLRFHCVTDCYWGTDRFRPGDKVDFKGEPPKNFPQQHFERE